MNKRENGGREWRFPETNLNIPMPKCTSPKQKKRFVATFSENGCEYEGWINFLAYEAKIDEDDESLLWIDENVFQIDEYWIAVNLGEK